MRAIADIPTEEMVVDYYDSWAGWLTCQMALNLTGAHTIAPEKITARLFHEEAIMAVIAVELGLRGELAKIGRQP
jgi:hypothetical protein